MTPTEQYKELVDNTDVGIILSDYLGSEWNGNMRDDIVAMVNYKFTADRKRVALEARIQALDHVIDLQDKQFGRWTQMDIANFFNDVGKYYRDLKAQQEEV